MNGKQAAEQKISGWYRVALTLYGLPFLFLFLFLLDSWTFDATEMWFWALFLFSLLPCGVLGVIATTVGLIFSVKHNLYLKKSNGYYNLLLGGLLVLFGLLGWGILYVVTS